MPMQSCREADISRGEDARGDPPQRLGSCRQESSGCLVRPLLPHRVWSPAGQRRANRRAPTCTLAAGPSHAGRSMSLCGAHALAVRPAIRVERKAP